MSFNRYYQVIEYMFVFSKGAPATANLIKDKENAQKGRYRRTATYKTGRTNDNKPRRREKSAVTEQFGRRSNIWRYTTGLHHSAPDFLDAHEHPAIMPIALAKDHIRTWSNPGDVVLDPMAGSGTTLRAAKDLGRKAIGFEIHEPYCELAARRLAQGVLPIADAVMAARAEPSHDPTGDFLRLFSETRE